MFTDDFRKFQVALGAIAAAVLLYVGINAGFLTLSQWVESNLDIYPYGDEDGLRYLVAGLFENRGHKRIMLAGESAVREDLLYKEFDRAFPKMRTFNGALSAETSDDLLISLEYIEKVYGRNALPRVLVLGISPRFVANLTEGRGFLNSIERYSPYFGVKQTAAGPELVAKTVSQRWLSWLRFMLFKQQKRYLASLSALSENLVSMDSMESEPKPLSSQGEVLRLLGRYPIQTLQQVSRAAVLAFRHRWASPYRFHGLAPMPLKEIQWILREVKEVLWRVQHWDPQTSQEMIADRFRRLKKFTEKWEIRLFVFNVPEHVESRQLYDERNYQRYLAIVRENLGDTPFLDLRELLHPDEFYDFVHATLPGAQRVTEAVIRFIKAEPGNVLELKG